MLICYCRNSRALFVFRLRTNVLSSTTVTSHCDVTNPTVWPHARGFESNLFTEATATHLLNITSLNRSTRTAFQKPFLVDESMEREHVERTLQLVSLSEQDLVDSSTEGDDDALKRAMAADGPVVNNSLIYNGYPSMNSSSLRGVRIVSNGHVITINKPGVSITSNGADVAIISNGGEVSISRNGGATSNGGEVSITSNRGAISIISNGNAIAIGSAGRTSLVTHGGNIALTSNGGGLAVRGNDVVISANGAYSQSSLTQDRPIEFQHPAMEVPSFYSPSQNGTSVMSKGDTIINSMGEGTSLMSNGDIIIDSMGKGISIVTNGNALSYISNGGGLYITSNGGPISLVSNGGGVILHSKGGPVSITSNGGAISMVSNGGPISINSHGGPVSINSHGGRVSLVSNGGVVSINGATQLSDATKQIYASLK